MWGKFPDVSYCSLPAGEFLLQEREVLSLISHALHGKARIRPPSGRGSVASRKSSLAFAVCGSCARQIGVAFGCVWGTSPLNSSREGSCHV